MPTITDKSDLGLRECPTKMEPENTIPVTRIWDLVPGAHFRGHTITAIEGVVGLGHNPVAVLFFSGVDRPAKIAASHSESLQHSDEVTLRAREWIRCHGLGEGDAIDLREIRAFTSECG